MHLVDLDIPGKYKNQETEVLSPGNELFSFNVGKYEFTLSFFYNLDLFSV